jgi:hypothetical protein
LKYRCRHTIIEAEQFFHNKTPWPKGITPNGNPFMYNLETLSGVLNVVDGDYIIYSTQGLSQVIKPDVFTAHYEPIESE